MEAHLDDAQVYRRMFLFDKNKIEFRLNKTWENISNSKNFPKRMVEHYKTSNSCFANIRGLIKTHKMDEDLLQIRPIVNTRGSPTHKLSFLMFHILQPLHKTLKYQINSSSSMVESLKLIPREVLLEYKYPISLDIKSMYTSIPVHEAIEVVKSRITQENFDLLNMSPDDIGCILKSIFDNSYVSFRGKIYKQICGLPMGGKISGLLASLFIDNLERRLVQNIDAVGYHRYVDDIFMLVKNEQAAEQVLQCFNLAHQKLTFELEKPVGSTLKLLDVEIGVIDGKLCSSFFVKRAKSDLFINQLSSMPERQKKNVILQEWKRILSNTDDHTLMPVLKEQFMWKLSLNGFKTEYVNSIIGGVKYSAQVRGRNDEFLYISLPFFNDGFNRKISSILNSTGLNIRISHRTKSLGRVIQKLWSPVNIERCKIARCPIKNQLCMECKVIYQCVCQGCGANYVGSTFRALHIRLKEHMSLPSSPIFKHNSSCKSSWNFKVLYSDNNVINLRIKEALLITSKKPSLNTKEDFQIFVI
jgi:hypothetical protein